MERKYAHALSALMVCASASLACASVTEYTELLRLEDSGGGAPNEVYGNSVAFDGTTAVVGQYGDNLNSGAVHVYTWTGSTMVEREIIVHEDVLEADYFGYAVAVRGDMLLIGAPGDDDKGGEAGAVYLYDLSTDPATFTTRFYSWDESPAEYFGWSIDLDDDYFIVGSPYDSINANFEGSATLYKNNGFFWGAHQKLMPKLGGANAYFGTDVDLDGDRLIVGAPGSSDTSGANRGVAYLYAVDGFSGNYEVSLLLESSSSQDGAEFGFAVDVSGDLIAIGAPSQDFGLGLLDVYYDVTGGGAWTYYNSLLPSGASTFDYYGIDVDIPVTPSSSARCSARA